MLGGFEHPHATAASSSKHEQGQSDGVEIERADSQAVESTGRELEQREQGQALQRGGTTARWLDEWYEQEPANTLADELAWNTRELFEGLLIEIGLAAQGGPTC